MPQQADNGRATPDVPARVLVVPVLQLAIVVLHQAEEIAIFGLDDFLFHQCHVRLDQLRVCCRTAHMYQVSNRIDGGRVGRGWPGGGITCPPDRVPRHYIVVMFFLHNFALTFPLECCLRWSPVAGTANDSVAVVMSRRMNGVEYNAAPRN